MTTRRLVANRSPNGTHKSWGNQASNQATKQATKQPSNQATKQLSN